jgi:hypothetical protein
MIQVSKGIIPNPAIKFYPRIKWRNQQMDTEKIKVDTETGQTLEVEVTGKKADAIWVMLGEGVHSVKCKLIPTRNGLAYAGSVMGRELIYKRSVKQVREDIARRDQEMLQFRSRR